MIVKYYEQYSSVPQYMAMGFAAYLLFMKCKATGNAIYYGQKDGADYVIQHEQAAYYCELWEKYTLYEIPFLVLSNFDLWGFNLSSLPGFTDAVKFHLEIINHKGVIAVLSEWHTIETLWRN